MVLLTRLLILHYNIYHVSQFQGKFQEAETEFIKAGKSKEAVLM